MGTLGILMALVLASTASASEPETVPEPAVIPASVWSVPLYPSPSATPAVGHTFTFWRYDDICDPGERVIDIQLRERPLTAARPFKSAVIKVTVEEPERSAPSQCPPGLARAPVHVRTKRPATSLIFYDGSYEPPRRFWPPIGTPPSSTSPDTGS
jgi:hypothetical protein